MGGRHTLGVVTEVRVREAVPADCPAIYELVVALAVYEKEPDAVEGRVDDMRAHLFGPTPQVFCHVAEAVSYTHLDVYKRQGPQRARDGVRSRG